MNWDYGWHHHMSWIPGGWILLATVLAGVAVYVAAAVRRGDSSEPPETILKRRYAGGEITREEYDRTLQELRR
jgi:uncharacterized membrane protein